MRYENSIMRALERIAVIEDLLKTLRDAHVLGDGLNVEINRLTHEKGQLLRDIGREVQLRFIEGKKKISLVAHDWSEFDDWTRRDACANCGQVRGSEKETAECPAQ